MAGTVIAIISASFTGISVISVLLGFILKGNTRQVKLEDRMERLEKDHAELERSSKEKFTDYYAFKSSTEKQLTEINTNVKNIEIMVKEIKEDIKGKN